MLKRPLEFKDSGPLYLTPLRKERDWTKSPVWYAKKPFGEHSINNFMRSIAVEAGFDLTEKNYTNHSLWKATVQKLRSGCATSQEVIAITGHKCG